MKIRNLILSLILSLSFAVSALAQGGEPQYRRQVTMTSATTSQIFDITAVGINYIKLSWDVTGAGPATLSACAFTLQGSSDGVTFGTTHDTVGNCTTDGHNAVKAINTATSFIRISVSSFTASFGSPKLNIDIMGWNVMMGASTTDALNVTVVSGGTANQNVNINQVAGNAVAAAGVNGVLAVGGTVANGGAFAGAANPVVIGGENGSGLVKPLFMGPTGEAATALQAQNSLANPSNAAATAYSPVMGDLGSNMFVIPGGPNRFSCYARGVAASLTDFTANGGTSNSPCGATLAAGLRAYVTDILVVTTTSTAGSWRLSYGTGAACGTTNNAIIPGNTGDLFLAPASTASPQSITFTSPVPTATAQRLCIFGTATNTINIVVNGYVAP